MSEELKTLKDLEWGDSEGIMTGMVYLKDIKAEEIKWIKSLENEKESIIVGNDLTKKGIAVNDGEVIAIIDGIKYSQKERNKIAQFLKYTYDITLEDLR